MSKVAVIGAGFVGLTTAVYLAEVGHSVACSDTNVERIRSLRNGIVPFSEELLQEQIAKLTNSQNLTFSSSNLEAIDKASYIFLCLPTPSMLDGSADVSILENVVDEIKGYVPVGSHVVIKSTVPVGTTRALQKRFGRSDCEVIANPEFLREGQALRDSRSPDRVVVGSAKRSLAVDISDLFCYSTCPLVATDFETAELIKYASNSYLAMRLSFVNEISTLARLVGASSSTLMTGLSLDKRIGSQFLNPGPGWGGSCFPKDTRALVEIARNVDFELDLVQATIEANQRHQRRIAKLIVDSVQSKDPRVAVLGLTFKAGTSDLRESPSIRIVTELCNSGISVSAYDPTCLPSSVDLGPNLRIVGSALEACDRADALVVLTEWSEFSHVSPSVAARAMRNRVVIDARGILSSEEWRAEGFSFIGVCND